jgi:SAM-dependent methyltransferase
MNAAGAKRLRALFETHRARFARKALLRRVYQEDFFPRLRAGCPGLGPSVEIGAGPGLLQQAWPEIFATDLCPQPWLDAALDAGHLPFRGASLGNIAGLDVLHHLPDPLRFLAEAARCLRPGGRLALIEPWLTPFSRFIYRHFHQEDFDPSADPFTGRSVDGAMATSKDPMHGNQALPYLLFGPDREKTLGHIPGLRLERLEPFGGITYLLSFGFKSISLAPGWAYPCLRGLERRASPGWKTWGALRALIVLAKS